MPVVSVAGASSRAGKTALAVTLLKSLPARTTTAVKFTTTEDVFERCPRGTPCVVCDIEVPYRIIEDPAVLRQAGTDTDRLAAAGAARVVWVIAKASAAARAWAVVRGLVARESVLIVEGSTVVDLAQPELLLFVAHPHLSTVRWKPTSGPLIARANAVIVNVPASERRRPALSVLAEIGRHRNPEDVRTADVEQPLAAWAPDLADRLSSLAGVRQALGGIRPQKQKPALEPRPAGSTRPKGIHPHEDGTR